MRVAWLDHCARLGGGELALLTSASTLGAHGVDGIVLLAEDGPLRPLLEEAGVEVRVLPLAERSRGLQRDAGLLRLLRSAGDLLRYLLVLRRVLRELDVDLVHANSLKSGWYGCLAARLAGIPSVFHLRDSLDPRYLPSVVIKGTRLFLRYVPDAVVANSRWTLGLAGRPRRAFVCYSPVDVGAALPRTGHDGVHLVMLGRLSPVKGQAEFLRAFAAAFRGRTDVTAEVVGSALFEEHAYADSLPALAADLGVGGLVDFVPFTTEIWECLARADVLAAASVMPEPFGQVVVQGLAAGLAVVAGVDGGPAEVVTEGVDGCHVDPRDTAAFAQVLSRLADDAGLREELGTAARRTAARYDLATANAALLAAYRSVPLRVRKKSR